MSQLTQWMDRTFYPDFPKNWDQKQFREDILHYLRPEDTLLDYGAGRGINPEMDFRGKAREIYGVDMDTAVLENPYVDEAKVIANDTLPFPDAMFDLVFSNFVLEHVELPNRVFTEVFRTLKPGGLFISRTPNRLHYVPVIAALTPHWFHQLVNSRRDGRLQNSRDVFPTYYRVNSPGSVRRFGLLAGFRVKEIKLFEGRPEYLRILAPAYAAGILYERVVNSLGLLARFRIGMTAVLEKPRP